MVHIPAWRHYLSVLCAAALLCGESSGNFSSLQSPAAKKTIIIHAGRLIDTVRKQVRTRVSITIEGERIKELQEGFVSLPNAQVIDLSNSTVLPGLIDCHKHLTMHQRGPNPFQDLVTETAVDAAFYAAANARLALLNGFTAVPTSLVVTRPRASDASYENALTNNDQEGEVARVSRAFRGQHQPKPLSFDPAKLNGLSEKLIRSHWENNYGGCG